MNYFRAKLKKCSYTEHTHQNGQVDGEMITDEWNRIHVTHNLGKSGLLTDWLFRNVGIQMNKTEKVQT